LKNVLPYLKEVQLRKDGKTVDLVIRSDMKNSTLSGVAISDIKLIKGEREFPLDINEKDR